MELFTGMTSAVTAALLSLIGPKETSIPHDDLTQASAPQSSEDSAVFTESDYIHIEGFVKQLCKQNKIFKSKEKAHKKACYEIPAYKRREKAPRQKLVDDIVKTNSLNLLVFELESLPTSLRFLRHLTSIDLTFAKLKCDIPSEIGCLTNLTSLDLSYIQKIGKKVSKGLFLPTEIGNLTQLTFLNLSNTLLAPMDPFLSTMKNLGALNYRIEADPTDDKVKELSHLSLLSIDVPLLYEEANPDADIYNLFTAPLWTQQPVEEINIRIETAALWRVTELIKPLNHLNSLELVFRPKTLSNSVKMNSEAFRFAPGNWGSKEAYRSSLYLTWLLLPYDGPFIKASCCSIIFSYLGQNPLFFCQQRLFLLQQGWLQLETDTKTAPLSLLPKELVHVIKSYLYGLALEEVEGMLDNIIIKNTPAAVDPKKTLSPLTTERMSKISEDSLKMLKEIRSRKHLYEHSLETRLLSAIVTHEDLFSLDINIIGDAI